MKKLFYIVALVCLFSCQENKDKAIESQLRGIEVNKQATASMPGKPPVDNPIFQELLNFKKVDLNRVDRVYIRSINEAKDKDYLDNLKQFGFQVLVKHGLIKDGSSKQKLFYINELLNSQANFANITDFYALLLSENYNLPKNELIKIEKSFYDKNEKLINSLDWTDKKKQKDISRELNYRHMLFKRYVNAL